MADSTTYRNALPLASMLLEYRLESVLGAGAFGITYLAWDTHLEKNVAIKEYLPTELAVRALDGSVVPVTTEQDGNYQWGRDRFILEARTLARFSHPNIVRVNRYFEANATGYMVMDYEKGESLSQFLRRVPAPGEAQLKAILMPLLDGLHAVHEEGFLHRDIKPSNVFIRESGAPVLLDFGAARQAVGSATKSLTSVLTPGYAPLEQYSSGGNQGAWSDIYALAGVLYRALVNDNPPDAVSRLRVDMVSQRLNALRGHVSATFLEAIVWGLALNEKHRPQSVREWQRVLRGEARVPGVPLAADTATTVKLDGETTGGAAPTLARGPSPANATPVPSRPEPKRGRRSPWRWAWAVLILVAVVAGMAAWDKQRRPEKVARAPETASEKPKPLLKPFLSADERRPVAAAPERPPRERIDRPGSEGATEPEYGRKQVAQEFRDADADGDGFLSRGEVRRFPYISKEFQRVDADSDGRISLQEFMQLRRQQAQQRPKK